MSTRYARAAQTTRNAVMSKEKAVAMVAGFAWTDVLVNGMAPHPVPTFGH